MKAAVLQGIEKIELEEIKLRDLKPGEILLKVHSCAVCGSDVRIFSSGNERVKYPAIIGHEMSGEIMKVGDGVKKFKVGDKIAVGADVPCGECEWCQNGNGNCCDINLAIGYQFQGGFAEYCVLEETVVNFGPIAKVPDGISMDEAALAEPLACCINGLERVFFKAGQSVLVIGAGPIGAMLVRLAKTFGSPLIVLSEIEKARLDQAKIAGADFYSSKTGDELYKEAMDLTNGKGFDVVLTACPSVLAHEDAIRVCGKRGFVNLFGGLPKDSRQLQIYSNQIHYKEMYITGSHGSTPRQHKLALDLIAKKRVNVADLITHRFSLEDIKEAINTVKNKQGLKVIVNP